MSTPPAVSAVGADAEAGSKIVVECRRQALGKDVGELLVAGNMEDAELANGHLLPDQMDVKLDVLGSSVMHGVLGHVDRRNIVTVDNGCLMDAMVEFAKKLAEPRALGDGVGDPSVFGLRARSGHRVLAFG